MIRYLYLEMNILRETEIFAFSRLFKNILKNISIKKYFFTY